MEWPAIIDLVSNCQFYRGSKSAGESGEDDLLKSAPQQKLVEKRPALGLFFLPSLATSSYRNHRESWMIMSSEAYTTKIVVDFPRIVVVLRSVTASELA